ncbi:MAG: hypothetical protein IJT48_09295, partial [Bacteroidaceae bacterium]|nr:hypothetical protein [Bacteroidaceae bacterium]
MKRLILSLALLFGAMFQSSVSPLMAQTDRGFIHPGGLHTQADFDRVRAQIAAGNTKVKQAYQKLKSAAY